MGEKQGGLCEAGATKRGENMGDLPQWVCWRAELREGKATKVLYSPESG